MPKEVRFISKYGVNCSMYSKHKCYIFPPFFLLCSSRSHTSNQQFSLQSLNKKVTIIHTLQWKVRNVLIRRSLCLSFSILSHGRTLLDVIIIGVLHSLVSCFVQRSFMIDSCFYCIRHGAVVGAQSEWLKTSPLSGPHTVADSYCTQKYLLNIYF